MRCIISTTLIPALSIPAGNITFAAGVFTCCHLMDGGLPPNCCAFVDVAIAIRRRNVGHNLTAFIINREITQFIFIAISLTDAQEMIHRLFRSSLLCKRDTGTRDEEYLRQKYQPLFI